MLQANRQERLRPRGPDSWGAPTRVAATSSPEATFAWVWRLPLQCDPLAENQLSALLETVESARAARQATSDLRRRFVVSHGLLRLVLASFTGLRPESIRVITGEFGKPQLAGGAPHFSLSHCEDEALVAVTYAGPVGVDIERVRADIEIDAIARRLLAAHDIARIEAWPEAKRERAWFSAWTRREAVTKACGDGLSEVPAAGSPFRTLDLDIDPEHVGAVAAPSTIMHVVYETLPDVPASLSRFGIAR